MSVPPPPLDFGEDPPDRDSYVLDQGFSYRPYHWTDRLADQEMWPDRMTSLNRQGRQWPWIARRHVFEFADDALDPLRTVHFYVAACAWGAGPMARPTARRVAVLTKNGDPGRRLFDAVGVLRSDGPVSAYRSLVRGGSHRLPWLGPGFFTKLLYFAGWDRGSDGRQPLILDQHVARALNAQAGLEWRLDWSWSADQYDRYLDLAHEWAQRWGTSEDVVERRLFERGKQLA